METYRKRIDDLENCIEALGEQIESVKKVLNTPEGLVGMINATVSISIVAFLSIIADMLLELTDSQ